LNYARKYLEINELSF